ncbi:hypothetical protein H6P81_001837 [Aristolochia fimbriata]|uniref:Uncharacterized protein n=1 Tax=Aristolochia fimbriata TaxID=158543 RepID=A0AAV7F9Q4_ARIFI|nr:hypothetical protein H6P81_001837 [Aristolochia fimbriata]
MTDLYLSISTYPCMWLHRNVERSRHKTVVQRDAPVKENLAPSRLRQIGNEHDSMDEKEGQKGRDRWRCQKDQRGEGGRDQQQTHFSFLPRGEPKARSCLGDVCPLVMTRFVLFFILLIAVVVKWSYMGSDCHRLGVLIHF